jgi:hypothetical protein
MLRNLALIRLISYLENQEWKQVLQNYVCRQLCCVIQFMLVVLLHGQLLELGTYLSRPTGFVDPSFVSSCGHWQEGHKILHE